MNFKYRLVKRPGNNKVRTPSIPIIIENKIKTLALIDSGADMPLISKNFAEILGIDMNKNISNSYGISGKIDSIESKINITINKGNENYNFDIPIKIILSDYDFPVLLGRFSFFDEFIISFNQNKERVSLKKI